MKNILLATHNKGKIKRYKALFKAIEKFKNCNIRIDIISLKVMSHLIRPLKREKFCPQGTPVWRVYKLNNYSHR